MGRLLDEELTRQTLNDEDLYDETPDSAHFAFELNDDLSEREIEEAFRMAYLTRGIMCVTGPPRQGKGLFSNVWAWKVRRYFKHRHILLDYKPRRLFGPYTPFNEQAFMADLEKMADVAKGEIPKEAKSVKDKKLVNDVVAHWITKRGEVLLQNSVLVLDEFWRYMDKRRPHNTMGMMLGGLIKLWGHLDMLLIGISPKLDELDAYRCIPYLNYEVRCTWSLTRSYTAECRLYKLRTVTAGGVRNISGRPLSIMINGMKPREELDGNNYFSIYNSKNAISMAKMKINL